MKKILALIVPAVLLFFSSFAVTPITGTPGVCVGNARYVYDSTTGGTWSSSNTAVATISASGVVYGVSAGTTTISYAVGSSFATMLFTVSPTPAAITGPTTVCVGGTITMSDATSGGTWSTSSSSVLTIGSSTGVITGLMAGNSTIYYTVGVGCSVTDSILVSGGAGSAGYIYGDSMICVGTTAVLTDYVTGGTWSSSNTAIATVSSAGVVTGVAGGYVTISYSVTGSCGTATATFPMFINTTGSAGTISGPTSAAIGSTYTYYDGTSGGTWTSSNTAVATINASTGSMYAIAAGTTTLSYTVADCGGTYTATLPVTVTGVNRISGDINFGSGAIDSTGYIKVWLITYNSSTFDLEAIDSMIASITSLTSAHYQFLGEPTDTYRVKAAYFPSTFATMGYVPTYHTNGLHWNTANIFYHTTSAANDGVDINMNYGTATTGPGFIGGNVTMGADKGTSAAIPAVNMLVFAVNSTTGALMQQTYTDATGAYSFSNLPVGATYLVYPEAINYNTTAYTSISLTTSGASFSGASFVQHTISKTITPIPAITKPVTEIPASVTVFPNPSSGRINIVYQGNTASNGVITVSDITGRQVYKADMNMNTGGGTKSIDLTSLNTGMYLISVKAGDLNYTSKIQINK